MPHSLWPRGLQHATFLCPPPSPRDFSNSCPLSICSLTISSSAASFSFFSGSALHIRWPEYQSFSFSVWRWNIIHKVEILYSRGKLRGSWATAPVQSLACEAEIPFWDSWATGFAHIPAPQQWSRRLTLEWGGQ